MAHPKTKTKDTPPAPQGVPPAPQDPNAATVTQEGIETREQPAKVVSPPVPVDPAHAATPDDANPPPEPKEPTLGERMDRIEAAITAALGVRLHEFDSPQVKAAREQVALDAAHEAQRLIDKAVTEAVKPLSTDERLERLEQIVQSSLNIPVQ